jgi:hypothetical protein
VRPVLFTNDPLPEADLERSARGRRIGLTPQAPCGPVQSERTFREHRRPMSPKVTISTLADLGPRNRLDAHCTRCRHSRQLDVRKLVERYGALGFGELRGRLRCQRCGGRRPHRSCWWCARRPCTPAISLRALWRAYGALLRAILPSVTVSRR